MRDASVRLYPMGGLGEIGMNCMAVEVDGRLIVIDCGVTFAERSTGADVIHPDFALLGGRADDVEAIIITHAHEDHIGGLPYLLPELPESTPVYAPPYAVQHITRRLDEFGVFADLRPTRPGQSFGVGPFEIEPVRVNHSIPDATALIIRTPHGTVVHSGDFKIERTPANGEPFGADRLREVGDAGVDLLLSDSTNVDVPGRAGEEVGAAEALLDTIREAKQRVLVATFASNVHRLRAIVAAAKATRRKVCLAGRSLDNHSTVARNLGMLPQLDSLLVSPQQAMNVPRDELIIVATGTQGEAPAALSRIARRDHRYLHLDAGDMVVLSARIIPGHETSVYEVINKLEREGVEVRHKRTHPGVHVSGHACREEQREMLELVRPRCFVPVHGTRYHLRLHAELARETGVDNTLIVENGTTIELDADGVRAAGDFPVGRVTRSRGRRLGDAVVRERALLGELGLAVVTLALDDEGQLVGAPRVIARGLFSDDEGRELLQRAEDAAEDAIDALETPRDFDTVEDVARRVVKRVLGRVLGVKPLVSAVAVLADVAENHNKAAAE